MKGRSILSRSLAKSQHIRRLCRKGGGGRQAGGTRRLTTVCTSDGQKGRCCFTS